MLLAGDVGPYRTTLAVISGEHGARDPVSVAKYRNTEFAGLDSMLRRFLEDHPADVNRASLSLPGSVSAGHGEQAELPWPVDAREIQESLRLVSVRLLSHLTAVTHAVPHLEASDLLTLSAGQPEERGTLGVIRSGARFGEAYLPWVGSRYRPRVSEGGRAAFAPMDTRQAALLTYLLERRKDWAGNPLEQVTCERVAAGGGLPNIYSFLRDGGYVPDADCQAVDLVACEDPVSAILTSALDPDRPCALCASTLDLFVAILGAEAGNVALRYMASGGVYVDGTIPRRIVPALRQEAFLSAFRSRGPMSEMLSRVPVYLITKPDTVLFGTALYGLQSRDELELEFAP